MRLTLKALIIDLPVAKSSVWVSRFPSEPREMIRKSGKELEESSVRLEYPRENIPTTSVRLSEAETVDGS